MEATKKFRRGFNRIIEAFDEIIIGHPTTEYICNVFKAQGFWSGVAVRIYYDENTHTFTAASRRG